MFSLWYWVGYTYDEMLEEEPIREDFKTEAERDAFVAGLEAGYEGAETFTSYSDVVSFRKDLEPPYIEESHVIKIKKYNPDYGDKRLCRCGHSYVEHFDRYDNMRSGGCMYCHCATFKPGVA